MSGPSDAESYARYLGLRLTAPGEARLAVRPELVNPVGRLLGPVGFALVDYAMADVVWRGLEPGRVAVTVSVGINFLAGCDEGEVIALARLDRRGGSMAFAAADVRDGDGRLLVTATGAFAVSS
jgi:uncharacterized protein (TIGR00369 family)